MCHGGRQPVIVLLAGVPLCRVICSLAGPNAAASCSAEEPMWVAAGAAALVLCTSARGLAVPKRVPADVPAGNLVLDPFDVSFREHRLEELKLCGTGRSVARGHRPDGAVAERDPIILIRELVELGHIPLPVEDLGQCCHLLVDVLA